MGRALWKKVVAIVVILIIAAGGSGILWIRRKDQPVITGQIYLNYDQASQGLAPDGTRLKADAFLTDHFFDRVAEALGGENAGITRLDIGWRVLLTEADPNGADFPAALDVCIRTHDNSLVASDDIFDAVMDLFPSEYLAVYGPRSFSPYKIDWDEAAGLEYFDSLALLSRRVDGFANRIRELAEQSASLEDPVYQQQFSALARQCERFTVNHLNPLSAYVAQYHVVKDPEAYLDVLRYQILNSYVGMRQDSAEFDAVKKVLGDFDPKKVDADHNPRQALDRFTELALQKLEKRDASSSDFDALSQRLNAVTGLELDGSDLALSGKLLTASLPVLTVSQVHRGRAQSLWNDARTAYEALFQEAEKVRNAYASAKREHDVQCVKDEVNLPLVEQKLTLIAVCSLLAIFIVLFSDLFTKKSAVKEGISDETNV